MATKDELGAKDVYDLNKLDDIRNWCYENGRSYWEYVEKCEGPEMRDFLANIRNTMKEAIERGPEHEGVLPWTAEVASQGCQLLYQGEWLSYFLAESWTCLCLCFSSQ